VFEEHVRPPSGCGATKQQSTSSGLQQLDAVSQHVPPPVQASQWANRWVPQLSTPANIPHTTPAAAQKAESDSGRQGDPASKTGNSQQERQDRS
jgi:hypothetical protein